MKGWPGGGAKHGGAVRSRGGRRQGTGPVVAGVSRKSVTLTGWRYMKAICLFFVHRTAQKKWTDLFVFSRLLFS